MATESCFGILCFIPLDRGGPKFFGFTELITGLAFMMLAWTTADVRYRFRIGIAPFPLRQITFWVVAVLGVLTLLTDLWRAEQWLVPQGPLTSALWQALLGGIFLVTFLLWAWYAFVHPSSYGRTNSKYYLDTLAHFVFQSSPSELAIIAKELSDSAKELVCHAPSAADSKNAKLPTVVACAHDILLLIADKRFCRVIVESSPNTALAFFHEMNKLGKFDIPVKAFARNVVGEAIASKDSFIYHEVEGYESGLFGYLKPLSQAMFSNYKMVETVGTIFEQDYQAISEWSASQWEAYSRAVLLTLRDYIENGHGEHSFVLYRSAENIKQSLSDLYKLNGVLNVEWKDDKWARLRVVVEFIRQAVEILDEKGVPGNLCLRLRGNRLPAHETYYDKVADIVLEVILSCSNIKSPPELCLSILKNSVWYELFGSLGMNGAAGKAIKFKVRRLIYDEIVRMEQFPNFKGSRILSFCLYTMGIDTNTGINSDSKALHVAMLAWLKRNYTWLYGENPLVAEDCLSCWLTFDIENRRLVQTYPANAFRSEPRRVYFELDETMN